MLAEAFAVWRERADERKDLKRKACKVAQRLVKGEMVGGFQAWRSQVGEQKVFRHKTLVVVQRMRCSVLAASFRNMVLNVELQLEERRKEAVMKKIVLRMMHRAAAEAMLQWRSNIAESRARAARSLRAVARWANGALSRCLEQWIASWQQGRRLRQTLVRIWHLTASAAWECWLERMAQQQQLRQTGRKVVLRLCRRALADSFIRWLRVIETCATEQAEESRRNHIMKSIVMRMGHQQLAAAVARWTHRVDDGRRLRAILVKALARMRRGLLAASLSLWQAQKQAQVLRKVQCQRVVLRLKHGSMSKCFSLWHEEARAAGLQQDDAKHRDAKRRNVVARLMHRCLALCFESWLATAATERRLRAKMASVLVRLARRGLCAAFLRWVGEMRRGQELRRSASRTILYMANRLLVAHFDWWLYQVHQCKRIRSHVVKAMGRAKGWLEEGALRGWLQVARQDSRVRKMIGTRCAEALGRALLCWDFSIWQRNIMLSKESKIVLRNLSGVRRSVLAAWEELVSQHRKRVIDTRRGADWTGLLWRKKSRLIIGEWCRHRQVMAARRARAVRMGAAHDKSLRATAWEEWLHSRRLRSFAVRLVFFGAQHCIHPVFEAWYGATCRRRFLRKQLLKALSRLLRRVLGARAAQWAEFAWTRRRHAEIARRISSSANCLMLRMVVVTWHKTARVYAIRDRWSARICLSEPRMGLCAPRRADRAWQRALLFEWLQLVVSKLGRRRLNNALVTRWVCIHTQRVMLAWRDHVQLSSAVHRLRSRATFYHCLLISEQVIACWRAASAVMRYTSDALRMWQKAAHDKYVRRHSTEFKVHGKRKAAVCAAAVGDWRHWARARRWFQHALIILKRSHITRGKRGVWTCWRTTCTYHAHLGRASAALIRKILSNCVSKAFWGLSMTCARVEVRQRTGNIGAHRHRSFLQHDAVRVWSMRQKQSARYWACVERRFIRYLSRVVRAWHQSALRLRRALFVCAASRAKQERSKLQECMAAWRWWCHVMSRAFARSCLVLHHHLSSAFWKWALSRPGVSLDAHQREVARLLNSACKTSKGRDLLRSIVRERITQRSLAGD